MNRLWIALLLAGVVTLPATSASAQSSTSGDATTGGPRVSPAEAPAPPADASSAPAPAETAAQAADADEFNPAQPEFTIVSLPTTLRLPKFKSAFRITHRFNRPLGDGDFGDLVGDAFGLDSGAGIGIEYRFSPMTNAQVVFHRTNAKTIQFAAQYSVIRQGSSPVSVDALLSAEGTNNFKDSYRPTVGAVISRTVGDVAGLYAIPMWLNNTNPLPKEVVDDNNTIAVGLGARIRVHGTTYVVVEATPRVNGFDPGTTAASFGIEKRVGRHSFQLNFANHFGSTLADIARGAATNDNWYMGFNIYRKFF
jgi:hypothetical protein